MFLLTSNRFRSIEEHVLSAQAYWSGDQAIVTVTTKAELRNLSALSRITSLVGNSSPGVMHVGKAHVYTWKNGSWTHVELPVKGAPAQFELWPYNGKLYTWDYLHTVREWNGQALVAVPRQRAEELEKSFPEDENNYVPAGADGAHHEYAVLQDPISRDEWHGYDVLAMQKGAEKLPLAVGDSNFELNVGRTAPKAGRTEIVALSINGPGGTMKLWEPATGARTISATEYLSYAAGPFLPQTRDEMANRGLGTLKNIAASVGAIFLIWLFAMGAIKPALLANTPETMEFAEVRAVDYPSLDVARWLDYTRRLEALGFVLQKDLTIVNGPGKRFRSIARIMVHPTANCFADVHQIFIASSPGLRCGLGSYLGEDWAVGIGDDPPNPGSAITRMGQKISYSCPGMQVEEMFRKHIETRDKIAADLGLPVMKISGVDCYIERANREAAVRRETLKKSNVYVLLLRFYKAKIQKTYEWLGDYPKIVEERTGHAPTVAV